MMISRRVSCLAVALAVLSLAAGPAAAQFDDFAWTLGGSPAGSGSVDASTMHIEGPDDPGECSPDNSKWFQTTAAVTGTVTVHFDWDNQDAGFGAWLADFPFYMLGANKTFVQSGLGGGFEFVDYEMDVSFLVIAGQTFGFGVGSADCTFGPGVLDLSDFVFHPNAWAFLDGALAGASGEPSLTGLGSLHADTPWTLSLVDAHPSAAAWMVLGTSVLDAPFKGGLLVPAPQILVPLVTNPAGRIVLSGTWPAGVASGTGIVVQYWIVDAGGPAGFAASNAVAGVTP